MALDATMLSPQEARTWIFICGEEPASFASETVALLDEVETHPDHDRLQAERDDLVARVDALTESVARAKAEGLSEAQTRSLMSEALQNAEQRVEELAARVRRGEAERDMANDLQRQLDAALLREEDIRRALAEVEGARRFEHDSRVRAERFGGELEVKYATQKGELAQREMRIKRLVEEVQRLELDLSQQREESEARIALLTRERDDKRDLASRLARDNETMRAETQRLAALLARARDDLQLMQEQGAQARAQHIAMRDALEREHLRAKEANEALIQASGALNQRERTIEELRGQLRTHDGVQAQMRHDNEALEGQLQHAQQTSAAHRSARERSEAALKGTSAELHRLQGELGAANEKAAVLGKRLTHAEAQLRESEARMHETSAEYRLLLTSADSELASTKHAIERIRAELSQVTDERERALQEREQTQRNIDLTRAELAQLQRDYDEAKRERAREQQDASARIAALEVEASKLPLLQRDLQVSAEALASLTDKKNEVDTALAFARAEVQRGEKEAREARVAAEQKTKTLDTLLAQADASAKDTQRKLDEELKRLAVATAQLATSEQHRAKAEAEANAHKVRVDALSARVSEVEQEKTKVTEDAAQEASAQRKQIESLSASVAAAERERVRVSGMLEVQKLRVDELSAAAAEAERERDRVKGELAVASTRMQGLSKEVDEERQKASEVLRLLDAERAEILALRKQLSEARASLREAAARERTTGSDLTAPSAAPKKSEEWETLDTFAAEEVMLDDWQDDGKTRVVK
jgi:chromosome segregation ATPase